MVTLLQPSFLMLKAAIFMLLFRFSPTITMAGCSSVSAFAAKLHTFLVAQLEMEPPEVL